MTLNVSDNPEYWRDRAEEAWLLAEQMPDARTRAIMVGIAEGYEKLLKWAVNHAHAKRRR
jgi:hypothetical protein